ncbi:MAG: ParB/RepB/Spo0J family partition protein, partial [Myxococcales bacterium]|nr:ParB/RepB/Spo0J family partition protein [Myxococcales bacterium]
MNLPKRPVLGRGLGALIPQRQPPSEAAPTGDAGGGAPLLRSLPIESLVPNRDQPRKHFEAALLRELADSIKIHGILQPIVVTPHNDPPGSFMIVAGERRWRSAQLAGLHDVPVVVRDTPESDRLELAVLENLQRLDLSPIEEAAAYRQLMDV